ncbi:MAG: hypothetical protein HRT45_09115 [Bdellovibrionales bacterium]|nr:hypothetical protein [Bdellovibrionales bacterium]
MASTSVLAGVNEERYLDPGSSATITFGEDSYTIYCDDDGRRQNSGPELYICDCTNGLFVQGKVTGNANSDFNSMCDDQVFPLTTATNCRKVN